MSLRTRSTLRLAAGLLALGFGGARLFGGPGPFTIAVPSVVTSLDPFEDSVASSTVLGNLYEPLVRLDSDMRVQPALATSWSSPDPLTWVFEIRHGVTFHDGRALRAADVVYSIREALRDKAGVRYYLLGVVDAEAVGPWSVRVRTNRPVPPLLNRITGVRIVPEGMTGSDLAARAVGTGAYRLAEWRSGVSARLVRFDGYWGPKPELPEAVIALGRSPAEAARGLASGEYSLAALGGSDFPPNLGGGRPVESLEPESLFTKFLAWDLGRREAVFCPVRPNPFLDARVREAVDLAIDREALARALAASVVPATQLVPRYVFGFDPALRVPRPDLARARALLQAAGVGAGFPVTLHTRPLFAPAAAQVRERLKEIGIAVTVEVLPEDAFVAHFPRPDFTMWLDRWGCASADVSELYENALHSRDEARGLGLFNDTGHLDRDLDRDIDATSAIESNLERRIALQQVMGTLVTKRYWLPLYTDREHYALDRAWSWRPRHDLGMRVAEIRRR